MMLIFLITLWRVCLFVIAFWSQQSFAFTPRFPYSDIYLLPSLLPQWLWGWANFDGVHYLGIAKNGYFAQYTQAFFPLYPLLIRIVGAVWGDRFLIVTGLTISFIALFLAAKIFLKLLQLDFSVEVSRRSLWFLLIFPTSFYLAAFYTESLFLLLVVSSFLFARRKRWIASGLCAAFASATRITGILLVPALAYEVYKNFRHQKNSLTTFIKIVSSPSVILAPLGLLGYMAYLYKTFGDPLYFWHAQPVFGAQRSATLLFPLQTLVRYMRILLTVQTSSMAFWIAFFELSAFIFTVVMLMVAHRQKIRPTYLLFGWLTVLLPTLTGTLSSIPRYILPVLPIYLVLGSLRNRLMILVLSLIFIGLLILAMTTFIRGWWVA